MIYTTNTDIRNDVYSVLLDSNLDIPEDMTVEQYADKEYDMDKVCRLMTDVCNRMGCHVQSLDSDEFFDVLERSERGTQEVLVDFADTDGDDKTRWEGVNVFDSYDTVTFDHFADKYLHGYIRYRLLVTKDYGHVLGTQQTPFSASAYALLDDDTAKVIAEDKQPGRFFIITEKGAIEVPAMMSYESVLGMDPYMGDTLVFWRHDGKSEARRITAQFVKDERK